MNADVSPRAISSMVYGFVTLSGAKSLISSSEILRSAQNQYFTKCHFEGAERLRNLAILGEKTRFLAPLEMTNRRFREVLRMTVHLFVTEFSIADLCSR